MSTHTFAPGDIVSVRSNSNTYDRNGNHFRFLAVITSGPVTLNTGKQGHLTLGAGEPVYPFDQTYHHADEMLPLGEQDGLSVYGNADALPARYQAFRAWAYPQPVA